MNLLFINLLYNILHFNCLFYLISLLKKNIIHQCLCTHSYIRSAFAYCFNLNITSSSGRLAVSYAFIPLIINISQITKSQSSYSWDNDNCPVHRLKLSPCYAMIVHNIFVLNILTRFTVKLLRNVSRPACHGKIPWKASTFATYFL